jgi:hypothetical protein
MTTPFSMRVAVGTAVTLSAPLSAGTNVFGHWLRDDGQTFDTPSTVVTMNSNCTMTATYTSLPSLTVLSSPSGVFIEIAPADFDGNGDGTTPLTRRFNPGASVSLTAPSWSGSNRFSHWELDGVQLTTSEVATATMNASHTMTAVFTQVAERVLTVSASNNMRIQVEVTPADINGASRLTTPCTFRYHEGASVVLTAPARVAIDADVMGDFVRWRPGLEQNQSLAMTMTTDRNVTAVYPEVMRFNLTDLDNCLANAIWPVRAQGDGEFNGHGPYVEAAVRFEAQTAEVDVWVRFYVVETTPDWTEGVKDQLVHTRAISPGYQYERMVSTGCKWTYTDTNTDPDNTDQLPSGSTFSCDPNGVVLKFEANGDTGGNDVMGRNVCDDSYLKVFWRNPVRVVVKPVN